jgi:hypothetical protein
MRTGAGTHVARDEGFRKGCGVCRRTYDGPAWEALPPVTTLPPSTVQPHLTVPAGWTVVVRRCTCGAVLAARSD